MTHPALITDEDLGTFVRLIGEGLTRTKAAAAIGFTWNHVKHRLDSRPEWRDKFDAAIENRVQAKLEQVDDRIEQLANIDNPSPPITLAWAKRHHPGYRDKQTVEMTSGERPLEVRLAISVDELRERLGRVVAAENTRRLAQPAPGISANGNGNGQKGDS